jgi:hypothetical protein
MMRCPTLTCNNEITNPSQLEPGLIITLDGDSRCTFFVKNASQVFSKPDEYQILVTNSSFSNKMSQLPANYTVVNGTL